MKWSRRGLAASSLVPLFAVACGLQACGTDEDGPAPRAGTNQPPAAPGLPGFVVDVDPVTGSADLMVAVAPLPPTVVNGNYEKAARDFIEQHKDALKLTNPAAQLALVEVALATDGTAHVGFLQRESGVPVDGVVIGVHFRRDGSVAMLTGPVIPDAGKTSTTPVTLEAAAITAAEADLKTRVPGYTSASLSSPASPKLVLVPEGARAKLAWKLRLQGSAGATFAFDYYIDAQSGGLLQRRTRIAHADGSGLGVHGDLKKLVIREMPAPDGRYAMYQGGVSGEGGRERIVTHRWDGEDKPEVMIRSNDPDAWDVVEVGSGAAVDAHRYTADTTEWFRSKVRYASFDGRGSPLEVIVHDNRILATFSDGTNATNHENAYWDGSGGMHYGDGNLASGVKPTSCALDVVGHEFMHGVTQYTSGLAYQGQSGALNEALSDIFGTFIEEANAPVASALFSIGEAAFPDGGIRDLAHPATKNQPDNVANMYTGAEDEGGVHINSGIINNAWYLMTWGGRNDTSQMEVVQSLSLDASRKLWWHTSRHLLRQDSDFDRAARQQTGWAKVEGMPLEAVACAWVATGVMKSDYVKSNYGVQCACDQDAGGDAGCADAGAVADGGTAEPDPEGPEPALFDSCKGRADGVYCSQLADYAAIVCEGETIASGQQCATKCIGPNGPGTRIQCEGQDPAPPPPPDDNAPMVPDSCDGKADGVYCSSLAPFSAYTCEGGSIASGQQCPEEKTCAGPNGPGQLVCR